MSSGSYSFKVFSDVGLLKTRELSNLGASVSVIEALFARHGVPITAGYLRDALAHAETIGKFWKEDATDLQPDQSDYERGMLLSASRVVAVAQGLGDYKSDLLPEKLKQMLATTLDPSYPHWSPSREALFELEFLSRLRKFERSAILREPPGADISLVHRYVMMQAECKYITSTSKKTALDQIEKACSQLGGTDWGIIAVEIDSHVDHPEILRQDSPAIAYQELSKCTTEFVGSINADVQDLLGKFSSPKAIIYCAHTNFMQKNGCTLDVGLCAVGNSAANLPSRWPDFKYLLSLAQGLREGLS